MRYTVYRTAFALSISLCLLLLASCSGSGAPSWNSLQNLPEPDDKASWNARFSSTDYVIAWGSSNQSMRQAELDAKAQVAAMVSSSIQSELVSVMESEQAQGEVRDYQKLESRIKTTARFDHAELIRTVPPTAHFAQGEHWVMATLSRREAVEELLVSYNSQATLFRLLAARLDTLQDDPPAFTTTWKDLQFRRQLMLPAAVEIRAVAGGDLPEIKRDEQRFQRAEHNRVLLLGNLQLVVLMDGLSDLNEDEIFGRLSAALANMGLSVVGDECKPDAVHLTLAPELLWTNVMGRVVQLELTGSVGRCGSDSPWNVFRIQGEHMRGEGRRPVQDLLNRMTPELVEKDLRRILKPYLPL